MLDRRDLLLAAAAAPATPAGGDALDRFFGGRMRELGVPGGALAVVRQGRVVKLKGYGLADIETARPADADSVFVMASASKFLTGLCAMQLVEAGKLDLDRPLAGYLPELAEKHPDARVRQALSHTSGLAPLSENAAYNAEYARREQAQAFVDARKLELFTPQEMITAGAGLPAQAPPGAVWRYNQYPFFLMGQVIARLSGMPFEAYVQAHIFDRLGMKGAAYGDHRALVPRRRPCNYSRETGVLQNFALNYSPSFWPAAGWNASARDAAKLLVGLDSAALVETRSLAVMAEPTPVRTPGGHDPEYGLACTSVVTDGRRWIGHEGGGCAYLGWWPAERLGVAVLFNLSGSHADGIETAVAKQVLG